MITLKSIAQVLFVLFIIFGNVLSGSEWHRATNGKRFLIDFSQRYNWYEAVHKCSLENLQLVEIDSNEKNQVVVELLNRIPKVMGFFWLGGTTDLTSKPTNSHSFYWISSGAKFTYTNWEHYNNGIVLDSESCVHTTTNFTSYKWGVQHCNSSMVDLICEEYDIENLKRKQEIDEIINQRLGLKTTVKNSSYRDDFSWKVIVTTLIWLITANTVRKFV